MLWWTIATAELRRGWLIKRRYPLDLLFSLAGGVIFLITLVAGAMLVTGGRAVLDPGWAPRIWGLVLAGVAGSALAGGMGYINQHTWNGTLEQVALSPVGLTELVLLRQVTHFLVLVPFLAVYGGGLWWLFPGALAPRVLAGSVAIVYFGMLGLGFMVTGLALLFQQVQSVLGVINMLLYPVPLLVSPAWLGAWSFVPYGLGLRVAMGDFPGLALGFGVPLAWLLAGWLFLRWAEGGARRRGVLGLY